MRRVPAWHTLFSSLVGLIFSLRIDSTALPVRPECCVPVHSEQFTGDLSLGVQGSHNRRLHSGVADFWLHSSPQARC